MSETELQPHSTAAQIIPVFGKPLVLMLTDLENQGKNLSLCKPLGSK